MEQIEQLLSKFRELNATELRLDTGQKAYYASPAGGAARDSSGLSVRLPTRGATSRDAWRSAGATDPSPTSAGATNASATDPGSASRWDACSLISGGAIGYICSAKFAGRGRDR